MKSLDDYYAELISALVDDELSGDERREIEEALERDEQYREIFQDYDRLHRWLQNLPTFKLDSGFSRRVMALIDQWKFGELLSAYLDDELSASDRLEVEKQLEENPAYRRMFEQLRSVQDELRSRPRHELSEDFADRVMARIRSECPDRYPSQVRGRQDRLTPASAAVSTGRATKDRGGAISAANSERTGPWRGLIWSAAAVAAALLIMLIAQFNQPEPTPPVADPTSPREKSTLPDVAVTPEPPGETVPDVPAEPPVPVELDESLRLVRQMQKANRKLVLVYEITMTPDGVQAAAFANLLRRHNIRFQETFAVGAADQEDLLKHRFLDGIGQVSSERERLGDVEMYLVTCRAWQGEMIYKDVMSQREGFAGFRLNLTSRDANDRVLGRLCQTAIEPSDLGTATRLIAPFAMFKLPVGHIGAFGTLAVSPDLLVQSKTPAPAETQEQPPAGNPFNAGVEFRTEILFVVRKLKK